MSKFDFRDMLGGASATVRDPDVSAKIAQIGEDSLPGLLQVARNYDCQPADVLLSMLTEYATRLSMTGHASFALEQLTHMVEVTLGIAAEIQKRGDTGGR